MHKKIGENLKLHRNSVRRTQMQCGDICGVTFQQYQKWEKGENRLSLVNAYRLSKFFGIHVADLLEGVE